MINKNNKPVIILSPLDWGLGHTTRCIPIIENLLALQCTVLLACEANSASEKILKSQFPQLKYLSIEGYHISYAKEARWFALKILRQVPKILSAIKKEHKQLKQWVELYHPDFIISDNRYGFYSKKVHSIFITHQLQIAVPIGFLEKWVQKLNYRFIHRFRECWVPDFPGKINIAGRLSHPQFQPMMPVEYIGPLCRIAKVQAYKKYKYLFLLSGPEPQRTMLENAILQIRNLFADPVLFIRGLPNEKNTIIESENFEVKNYCHAEELAIYIAQSEYIVCRSGYTTVMELLYLQKKTILIPTPGQTEQEYLAKKLKEQNWAFSFQQNCTDYFTQITNAQNFHYELPPIEASDLLSFLAESITDEVLSN